MTHSITCRINTEQDITYLIAEALLYESKHNVLHTARTMVESLEIGQKDNSFLHHLSLPSRYSDPSLRSRSFTSPLIIENAAIGRAEQEQERGRQTVTESSYNPELLSERTYERHIVL